jgi:hypothetical protein
MMKLKNIFLYSLLAFIFSACYVPCSTAQDTLYYSVENVYEYSSSNISGQSATNKGDKAFSKDNSKSVRQRKDSFLIPFIISQIKLYTTYQTIKPLSLKSKRKTNYNGLKISINKFNNNLEYQFYLYESKSGNYDSTLVRSSSFFINPENPEYSITMKSEIQKLFEGPRGTNKPPVAKIRIDGKLVSKSCTYYRSNLDTIFLDGSSSEDAETPKKYLKYMWRVTKNGNESAFLPDFKFENCQQKLVICEAGVYAFTLEVSDGVTTSEKASFNLIISVITKPVLELHQNSFVRVSQKNMWSAKEKEIYRLTDSIGFNVKRLDSVSNLVFKYLYSHDKLRKYFIERGTGIQKNLGEISIIPAAAEKQKIDTTTVAGLKLITDRFDTVGSVKFWLSDKISPGIHKYLIYTDFNSVTSNFDTVTITFREKHFTSVYVGYDRFQITQGKAYNHGFALDVLRFGVRAYVSQRLYIDVDLLNPFRSQNFSNSKNLDIGSNILMGQINYDILPLKLKKMCIGKFPTYLGVFLSYYQLTESDSNSLKAIPQWGLGIKPRVQLLADKPYLGVMYIEPEAGYYTQFGKNPYSSWTLGVKLIYGFWNY